MHIKYASKSTMSFFLQKTRTKMALNIKCLFNKQFEILFLQSRSLASPEIVIVTVTHRIIIKANCKMGTGPPMQDLKLRLRNDSNSVWVMEFCNNCLTMIRKIGHSDNRTPALKRKNQPSLLSFSTQLFGLSVFLFYCTSNVLEIPQVTITGRKI